MSNNINDASLANLKHFKSSWKHGRTRTIRVPIMLADRVLEFARQLDELKSPDTSENIEIYPSVECHEYPNSDRAFQSRDTSDIFDAATLLNQLKSRNKKSKATLKDVEAILEMLGERPG